MRGRRRRSSRWRRPSSRPSWSGPSCLPRAELKEQKKWVRVSENLALSKHFNDLGVK